MEIEGPPKTGPFSPAWVNWLSNVYQVITKTLPVAVEDEGTSIVSRAAKLNFVGTNVTATASGNDVTVTISGGTFTNGVLQSPSSIEQADFSVPAGVSEIKVMFDALDLNGNESVYIQLGTSLGIELTGYRGGSSRILTSVASIKNTSAILIYRNSTNESINGTLHLSKMDNNTWTASGDFFSSDVTAAGFITGCTKTLSDVLTTIRIKSAVSNQFISGSINVKYI